MLNSSDHEQYRIGQIVGAVGDCYLIQFDNLETDQPLPPMELHTLGELKRDLSKLRSEARQLIQ